MTTLALSGQRAAALAQYESCRQVLAAELDTEPEIETTAIYEQIRSGTLVVDRPEQPRSSSPNGSIPPYALPAQVTPFIGRKKELTQIGKMLLDPDCRLLTIFGPGGIGKTRLALQAATKQIGTFRDGVYFIPVAAENSAETLLLKLAQTLRFSFYRGEDPLDQLQHYLREKNILLILDGFEHLLTSTAAQPQVAVALLTDILQNAPATKIVVVSRERLNVHGEWLLNIEGLTYPVEEATEDFERYSAIQLFVQSAHRVQPEFALSPNNVHEVIRICQLVEGMPLAIELATAWLRALTCREIVQEIQQNLDFLTTSLRDLPERHRNLRAVFDHSWELLSAVEQRVFCQLSVFQAGFSRDAAEAVTGVTPLLLVSLVDKSLLRRISSWRPESRARYGMHDLLKRYGSDQLGALSEEQRRAKEKHSTYYLAFLRQREPELKGRRQRTALAAIEAEIDNIRVAWHWAIAHGKTRHIEQALESLFLYYYIRSWFQEGEEAFGQLVQSLGAEKRKQSRLVLGRALACQGWFAFHLGRQAEARDLIQQGLSQLRKLDVGAAVAFCLNYLGAVVKSLGAYQQATEACLESLAIFREEGDLYGAAIALNILGQVAYLQGHEAEAQRLYQESLTLHREIGDQWGIAFSLDYLGQVAFSQGAFDQAKGQLQESLSIRREMGDQRGTALCLNYLGDAAEALGEYDEAAELYEEGLLNFKEIGHQTGIAQSLTSLGQVTFVRGDYEQAQRRFAEALEAAMAVQAVPSALNALFRLAVLLARTGDKVQAFNLLNFVRNHPLCPRNDREKLEQLYLELVASVPADAAGQVGASGDSASLETMIGQVVAAIRAV
jgi:predicted ATPase